MHRRYATLLMFVVAVLAAGSAPAALLSSDWQVPGDNLLTLDTDTSLEWLDITQTAGLTFTFVAGEFGPGGQFEGFRVATQAELEALAVNAGIAPGNLVANYAPTEALLLLLGCTANCGTGDDDAYGRDATSPVAGSQDLWSFQLIPQNPSGGSFYAGSIPDGETGSAFGTWLVREAAPVPVERTTWGRIKTLMK